MKALKHLLGSTMAAAILLSVCSISASAHTHPGEVSTQPIVSDWAKEEVSKAEKLGLIPQDVFGWPQDYREPVSRDHFQRIAMEFVALQTNCDYKSLLALTDEYRAEKDFDGLVVQPFTDGGPGTAEAYYLGVIKGRGNGIFAPDDPITRQEAAVLLVQAYTAYSGEAPAVSMALPFSDAAQVDAWAKTGVEAVSAWGVMKGMDDGSFSPKGYYSLEQCILTFVRLYEKAPVTRAKGNGKSLYTYEQCVQLLEAQTRETKDKGYGFSEVQRITGPRATFIRMDLAGMKGSSSVPYFVYQEGGMRVADLGICLSNDQLDVTQTTADGKFNDFGDIFTCTVTVPDTVSLIPAGQGEQEVVYHEKGDYFVKVDVMTMDALVIPAADRIPGRMIEDDKVSYVDERLGFSMEFPESWLGKLEVEQDYDKLNWDGGHGITFYHKPTRESCSGGVLFHIDCYPGLRAADNPLVMAGSSVLVLQTDRYTFFFRTPSDVQWHEHDKALEQEYKEFMADFEYVRTHIAPITEDSINYNEEIQKEAIAGTVVGFYHRPFEELPQDLRDSLEWDGRIQTEQGIRFRLRSYTGSNIVITTTEATDEALQDWLDWQLSLPEGDEGRMGSTEELRAEYECEKGREWLYSVTITDDRYATLLGLRVGNTVEEAEALGYPLLQRLNDEGYATFGDTWKHSLQVYVEDNVITKLHLYWGIGRYTGKYFDL